MTTLRARQAWATSFVSRLATLKMRDTFNPYADVCPIADAPDAPALRRANLIAQLTACQDTADAVWLGREPGYRGARRTGLALTDEMHLDQAARAYGIRSFARATRGTTMSERTAAVAWSLINRLSAVPMTWNAFPLHAHQHGNPMSNRCHTRAERVLTDPLLRELLDRFSNATIVAIGNDARDAVIALGVTPLVVRHPSYGGQSEFTSGILAAFPQKQEADLFLI